MLLDKLQQGWRRAHFLNYVLLPIAWCYGLLMKLRQGCYQMGICQSTVLSVPVIVVGNISVGGSGKSPLVMLLVNHLKAKGFKPGVICRGYAGKSAFWPRQVNHTTSAKLVGDEPQLIFEQCDVAVVAGPDRVQNGYYLIDKLNCNILISDDGYQHFALKRTVDIVVIDAQYGFGNGWCLPAGPLREPKSALRRADIVVLNGESTDQSTAKWLGNIPCYSVTMKLQDARNLMDNRRRKLSEFLRHPVHAVAGIGNPERFFLQLEQAGIDIIRHVFPDHHDFGKDDLSFADNNDILMTEKDGIKCRALALQTETWAKKIWVISAHLCVDETLCQRLQELLVQRNAQTL